MIRELETHGVAKQAHSLGAEVSWGGHFSIHTCTSAKLSATDFLFTPISKESWDYATQHLPVHHPLKLAMTPQPSYKGSTLATYLINPPTSSSPYLGNKLCWAVIKNRNRPLTDIRADLRIKIKDLILVYNHGSQKLKSKKMLVLYEFFHGSHKFFMVFEITAAGGSLILIFSKNQNWWLFDSEMFEKLKPAVLWKFK